ncbi:hypothetical protein [Roseibium sp.]|uniref:hypothetical protein n=1 Tax=Roseibium sp. TaxID=1936156 RepID=UPI00328E6C23
MDNDQNGSQKSYGLSFFVSILMFAFMFAYIRDPAQFSAGIASWRDGIASLFG